MIVPCIHETLGTGSDSMQGMLTKCSACWNYGNSSGGTSWRGSCRGSFLTGICWAQNKTPSPASFKYAFPSHTTDFRLSFSFFPLLNKRVINQVDFRPSTNRKYTKHFSHCEKIFLDRGNKKKSDNFSFVCGKRVRDIYNTTQKIFFNISIRQCLLLWSFNIFSFITIIVFSLLKNSNNTEIVQTFKNLVWWQFSGERQISLCVRVPWKKKSRELLTNEDCSISIPAYHLLLVRTNRDT